MADRTLTNDLLTAALDIFGERGFEGASTRAIAQRAGAHQQQITYHFGTKERLWQEAVTRVFDQFIHQVVTPADNAEPRLEVRLRATLERYLRFCRDNPQFAAITMWERAGTRGAWLEDRVILPMMRALFEVIFARPMPADSRQVPPRELSFVLLLCQASTVFTVKTHLDRGFAVDAGADPFFATYLDAVTLSLYPLALTL